MKSIITLLADGTLIGLLIVAGLCGGLWFFKASPTERRQMVPLVVMSGLTSLLIGKLLSLVYQPSVVRPFIERGVEPAAAYINNPGFPSDHVLLATIVVLAVYMVTKYRRVALGLAVVVLIMGVARVVALVHTPVDVVGGLVAGMSGGLWYVKRKP